MHQPSLPPALTQPRPRLFAVTAALFLGGLAISAAGAAYVAKISRDTETLRLRRHGEQLQTQVSARLTAYTNSLLHVQALIAATGEVNTGTFHRYIKAIDILDKYPGTLGIGYLRRVPGSGLAAHVREMRKKYPAYKVWPEGERDEYYPISHYEPDNETNLRMLGFDARVWPDRRATQDRAIETGLPAATARLVLARDQPEGKIPGFLFFAPIYRPGARLSTPQERKDAVVGLLNSTFRATTFFEALLSSFPANPHVAFEVYDGTSPSPGALFHAHRPSAGSPIGIDVTGQIDVGGRPWTLVFHAYSGFSTFWARHGHWALFAAGVLLTSLLSWQLLAYFRRGETERELMVKVRQALAARDEFLSIASHELRTPVTSLKLQLELATIYGKNDPEKALGKIARVGKAQVARLEQLVNELLDVTRIESGRMRYAVERTDLNRLAQEVLEHYRASLERSGNLLELTTCGSPLIAEVDPMRMSQALENLLSNAVKYGNAKPVKLSLEREGGNGLIRVSDQGVGIPRDKQQTIFGRFERLASTERVGGLGLGLYITKKIVDAHKGEILVESEPGTGSTFTIRLPLQTAAAT